jgi:hypothetical protein
VAKVKAEKQWTREFIWNRIQTSDKWMVHGLLAIYDLQTPEEQNKYVTIEDNHVGFTGVDAPFMTGMAKWWNDKHFFTDKQKVAIRKTLEKYCGQLEKIANKEI